MVDEPPISNVKDVSYYARRAQELTESEKGFCHHCFAKYSGIGHRVMRMKEIRVETCV